MSRKSSLLNVDGEQPSVSKTPPPYIESKDASKCQHYAHYQLIDFIQSKEV